MLRQERITNTHRIPFTRSLFKLLYSFSAKKVDYRTWLTYRTKPLTVVSAVEKDFWILLSSGLGHRIRKSDELRFVGELSREESIRGLTLIDQLIQAPLLQTLRLADIRLAHPLLLEQIPSQKLKFEERCSKLRSWLIKAERFLDNKSLEELIPSADPIIVTRDPLERSLYVAATGNGRMAALKEVLPPETYIEVLTYLPTNDV